jgi:hypothetical protein
VTTPEVAASAAWAALADKGAGMGLFARVRPLTAAIAVAGILVGLGACDGGGASALPSSLPSIGQSAERDKTTPPDDPTSETPRVTRTAAEPSTAKPTTAKPTTAKPTTAKPTTAKPTTAKPTTAKPADEPVATTAAEPAPTTTRPEAATQPPATTPPTTAATTASVSPSAVAAATTTSGIGTLGWLLLLLVVVVGVLLAVLLVSRSRRTAAWQLEAANLAAADRGLIATRLPQVLSTRDASARALAWPPVRAGLTDAAARWGLLADQAPDEPYRGSAGRVSLMLQDLVAAVDAENEALGTGRDWRQLSPRVDEIVGALDAALVNFLAPQPEPGTGGAEPYPV